MIFNVLVIGRGINFTDDQKVQRYSLSAVILSIAAPNSVPGLLQRTASKSISVSSHPAAG
jgi:hypothetical protein